MSLLNMALVALDLPHTGANWYTHARDFADETSARQGIKRASVVGVMAALSPQVRWDYQIAHTDRFVASELREIGSGTFPGYGRNLTKARGVLHSGKDPLAILRGPKVTAFYRCIMGDPDAVVIDRHAARAAGLDPDNLTMKRYRDCADLYRTVAAACAVSPRQLQAAIWNLQRRLTA